MNHLHADPMYAPLSAGPLAPERTPSPEAAFQRLLDQLYCLEPRHGWTSPEQIGALTRTDVAVILRREPTIAADATCDERVTRALVYALSVADCMGTAAGNLKLGADFYDALAQQARVYLLGELQTQAARQNERNRVFDSHERAARDARSDLTIAMDDTATAALFV
jgi:hypothetical protein